MKPLISVLIGCKTMSPVVQSSEFRHPSPRVLMMPWKNTWFFQTAVQLVTS